jgi:hypothetical protein
LLRSIFISKTHFYNNDDNNNSKKSRKKARTLIDTILDITYKFITSWNDIYCIVWCVIASISPSYSSIHFVVSKILQGEWFTGSIVEVIYFNNKIIRFIGCFWWPSRWGTKKKVPHVYINVGWTVNGRLDLELPNDNNGSSDIIGVKQFIPSYYMNYQNIKFT